jgi:hypothetical protein
VLGKWLAALAFFATGVGADARLRRLPARHRSSPDPGPIAAGYLGTILLGAATMAVGVAASRVTRNQLVAAALSFVLFFVALLAARLEGQVRSPEVAAVGAPRQPVSPDGGLRSRHRRLAPGGDAGGRHGRRAADRDPRCSRACAARCPRCAARAPAAALG